MRWPRPWRGKNTSRMPASVPQTNSSDGSPNGVVSRTRSTSCSPGISYNPLPPITPTVFTSHLYALIAVSPGDFHALHTATTSASVM